MKRSPPPRNPRTQKSQSALPTPSLLTPSDGIFPARLRNNGIYVASQLNAIGNLSLLDVPSIAIIGSRHCSEKGFLLARRIAATMAHAGISTVSGYAKGIDSAAHLGCLEGGGGTVFVLPFGIKHFRIKRELRAFITERNFLAISQFPPSQPWFASAAMKRNKVICALADAVIVIEAGETGGTIEGARVAKEFGKPLYVINYQSPPPSAIGNRGLMAVLGAQPLSTWHDVRALVLKVAHEIPQQNELCGEELQQSLF